jgi:multiple sugar transport system permease protein
VIGNQTAGGAPLLGALRIRPEPALRVLGIGLVLFLCLLPLLWTAAAALGLQPVRLGLQGLFTLDNFGEVAVFEPAFLGEFAFTLAVTLTSTALTLLVAFPAAYRLARTHSARVEGAMQGLLVLAVIPIIAYGLPLADIEHRMGLYGSFVGLVLAYAAIQLPLALWLLRGYLVRVPGTLFEAAILDGASWLTALRRVILPVAAGGVLATGVLIFVLDWNQFLLPSLLTEHPPMVLPMAMHDFFAFERELEWPVAAAALLVTLVPAFVLVLATQRALERLVFVQQDLST